MEQKSQYHTVTAGSFLEMNREKAEIPALALIFTLTVSRASMGAVCVWGGVGSKGADWNGRNRRSLLANDTIEL